jgi:hypothetical protein
LVEVLVTIFEEFSPMQATIVSTSFRSAPIIITTTRKLEPIRTRIGLAIISYTLPLPIEPMEILVVVTLEELEQVEALEELVILKPIQLIILEIGIAT